MRAFARLRKEVRGSRRRRSTYAACRLICDRSNIYDDLRGCLRNRMRFSCHVRRVRALGASNACYYMRADDLRTPPSKNRALDSNYLAMGSHITPSYGAKRSALGAYEVLRTEFEVEGTHCLEKVLWMPL
jgi:hypothetical protein